VCQILQKSVNACKNYSDVSKGEHLWDTVQIHTNRCLHVTMWVAKTAIYKISMVSKLLTISCTQSWILVIPSQQHLSRHQCRNLFYVPGNWIYIQVTETQINTDVMLYTHNNNYMCSVHCLRGVIKKYKHANLAYSPPLSTQWTQSDFRVFHFL